MSSVTNGNHGGSTLPTNPISDQENGSSKSVAAVHMSSSAKKNSKGNGPLDGWLGKTLAVMMGLFLTTFATVVVGLATFKWKATLTTAGLGLTATIAVALFAVK